MMPLNLESFLSETMPARELDIPMRGRIVNPEVVAIIPVAAHQENIIDTLRLYQNQMYNKDKWQVYLYLNAPTKDKNNPQLQANISTLQEYISKDTDPPFSWGLGLYDRENKDGSDKPVNMSEIRNNAWWHALNDMQISGVSLDTIALSHDADSLRISPNYFKMAREIGRAAFAKVITTDVLWSIPTDSDVQKLPALNRLFAYISISELALRQTTNVPTIHENAIGFAIKHYIGSGGYKPGYEQAESVPVMAGLKRFRPSMRVVRMPEEYIVTSARRQVMLAARNQSPFSYLELHNKPAVGSKSVTSSVLKLAEVNTSANLNEWCQQLDTNNRRTIEQMFTDSGVNAAYEHINYYNRIVNFGRQLLKASGETYNDVPLLATNRTRNIIHRMIEAINRADEQNTD